MPSRSTASVNSLTRRDFLATTAAGLYVANMAGIQAFAQPSTATLRKRQNALTLPPNDPVFSKYAEAVKKMHELPNSDLRSWKKQAEIHPNHCAHSTSGFLPWHRHYINEFEKICGKLIGDTSFALPYWDWTTAGGKIPDAFFDIAELTVEHWNDSGVGSFQPSPPKWGPVNSQAIRAMTKGQRAQDDPQRGGNFTAARINQIKSSPTYSLLRKQLEGSPHNSGHVVVGLDARRPWGHMVDGLSPLDPLFWLHHCNVDRIWAEWQIAGNNTPSFNQDYDGHFANANGNSIDVTADGSIDFRSLGFTYDTIDVFGDPLEFLRLANVDPDVALSPTAVQPRELKAIGSANVSESLALNVASTIPVPVTALADRLSDRVNIRNSFMPNIAALTAFDGDPKIVLEGFGAERSIRSRVYAVIRNASTTSKAPPSVNVYLNCSYLTAETAYTDEHFAGSFSFFGHSSAHAHAGHAMGHEFVVDITDAVERLGLANSENVKVQLLPVVPDGEAQDSVVTVKAISIVSL